MRKVNLRAEIKRLKQICEKEKIEFEEEVLHEISRKSEGDLRAAINDLQTIAQGKERVGLEDLKVLEQREKQVQIFDTLLAIFKSKDKKLIRKNFQNSDKSPDEILLWLVENIEKEYEKPEEVAKAFDALSRADVFRGRIIHSQAWTLQSFSNELMALGTAFSKKEKYRKFTKYSPPGILLKMGRTKATRALRDQIASEIGKKLHCSRKRAIEQFPYLSLILKKKDLNISEDCKNYLKKY